MKSSKTTMHKCLLAAMIGALAPVMYMPTDSYAQATSTTIRGTVTSAGAASAGAQVSATNRATGLVRSATANPSGRYVLQGLPPGTYTIQATAAGQTTSEVVTTRVEIGRAHV